MRATRRNAKPGQVLFFYGKLPGDNPDHICMWGGSGATKRHSNVVMHGFMSMRPRMNIETMQFEWGGSFLNELAESGFDISTIQFSIQVKEPSDANT